MTGRPSATPAWKRALERGSAIEKARQRRRQGSQSSKLQALGSTMRSALGSRDLSERSAAAGSLIT